MIEKNISFSLPLPWKGKTFKASRFAPVNFIVGPNGSGKSQFAKTLASQLNGSRLLGTDRLGGMEQANYLRSYFGDNFASGFAKGHFDAFKQAGQQGSGIDTIVLLEERLDIRIQVEATLSHLFNRKIFLDWDSGHLVPRAVVGQSGDSYRLDREECHGIKEMLVLLSHLYSDANKCLIIDEPELNLHPQYQAFFMQEVRRVAGNPEKDPRKKAIFLVTHSPFILDFRSIEDVQAVISFSLDHSEPKQILDLDTRTSSRLSSLVPRLNVHHKQLFFSDNPIFVEGILDAQLIGTMQDARGVSVAGAGSCIIDAGGCEEVNRYLELCLAFGKEAHFLYDLDSLFGGNLRGCIKEDGTVQHFLASAGVGNDFSRYCGELDRKLTRLIDQLIIVEPPPPAIERLIEFLRGLGPRQGWDGKRLSRARVAFLTALSRQRDDLVAAVSVADICEVEGRLSQISSALQQKNVHLLTGGTLERYLPAYTGDPYELRDETKRQAVAVEMGELATGLGEQDLKQRYGELYEAVCKLPSKASVDVEPILREYLSRYIHELQAAVVRHPGWGVDELRRHLANVQQATIEVFSIGEFSRGKGNEFKASLNVAEMLDQGERFVVVDHLTNAGMGVFHIEPARNRKGGMTSQQ